MYPSLYPRPPEADGAHRGRSAGERDDQGRRRGPGDGVVRVQRARRPGSAHLRPDRRRTLEPHLCRHRRRRQPLRAAPASARPSAGYRPRHEPRAQDHLRPRAHRRAGGPRPWPLHRRGCQRCPLLRHGLRGWPRAARRHRRPTDHS